MLRQFVEDLALYAGEDHAARRRNHYAIERLLQLLCESAADTGIQVLRREGVRFRETYRDIFAALRDHCGLPEELADRLMDACGMRNVLTHLYDTIDQDRVIAAVEPAVELYRSYLEWLEAREPETGSPR